MVGGRMRTRRWRRSTRTTVEEAQQDDDVQQQVEQQAAVDAAMTTLSRTPQVLVLQVQGTSTCEVPRVSLSVPYFETGGR
jgi:hypothetical protein